MNRASSHRRGALILLAFTLALALPAGAVEPADDAPGADETTAHAGLEDLRAFSDAFAQVRRSFVDTVDEKALLDAAIRGMLQELDPHSAYLPAQTYRDLDDASRGRYGGIGVRLDTGDGDVRVDAVINGSPADRAGIDPGDRVIAVDGQPVAGRPLQESVDGIDGEPGSTVRLSVQKPGEAAREVTLEREFIKLPTLSWRALDRGWGYFRMSQFHQDSAADLEAAIESVRAEAEPAGLVLDLRGNPGGVLQPAIEIADGFLDDGVIVSTRGRNPTMQMEFRAQAGQWLPDRPLVVLVDRRSASASEVLAGALQDHRRALIVGERTFGKGSVQSVLPLRNGAGLKLTTARYFTPSGRSIQAEGIVPDLAVALGEPGDGAEGSREADLAGHLAATPAVPVPSGPAGDISPAVAVDEVLEILRGAGLLEAAQTAEPGTP